MAVSLKKDGFSLGEIEGVLGHMHRINPTKRATFSARLQQLQRLGLPQGGKPGRGKRPRYEFWQVADFSVCVDLLDVGIPPQLIQTHFAHAGIFSMVGLGHTIEQCPPTAAEGYYVFLELHALNYLRSASTEAQSEHAADHVMKFGKGPGRIIAEDAVTPTIALNLSKRLADLKAAVAEVMPSHIGEATFPPVAPRPGMLA